MAGAQQADHAALHPDVGKLAEPGPDETFFAIITRQAIHRGSFGSVDDLVAAIRRFDAYNDRCEPFTWTRTADDILTKLKPQTISATAY